MPASDSLATRYADTPAVRFDHVCKSFVHGKQTHDVINQLSWQASASRITGLVGPDGAGKTSIMRLCAGLLLPTSGQIEVLGLHTERQARQVRKQIGYMPQRFGLYEDLTVAENLGLYADLHGVPIDERHQRLEQLLGFTGLGNFTTRLAGRLSGGMKQKLGLACILMQRPDLLLLDEPTVGVDPVSRRELWRMINTMQEAGTSVVISTAYLEEAERCDEVLLLHDGKLLASGQPSEFRDRLKGRTFSLPVSGSERRQLQEQLQQQAGVLDAVLQGNQLRILMEEQQKVEDLLIPNTLKLTATTPRFEDAFIDLLTKNRSTEQSAHRINNVAETTTRSMIENKDAVIRLEKLRRCFGSFVAVNDVDLTIHRGEIVGLLGPNGAGKSTVIRMLCGLLTPSSGQSTVLGVDLARAPGKIRSRIGYMSQRFSLYRQLSVVQNLRFFAGTYTLRGKQREQRIRQALDVYDLARYANATSGTLPLGYLQRLALACALLHEPEIVFLDEPTSGVDPIARRAFWTRINTLAQSGVTVLVTTHFLEEAEYCDRLAIMHEGRIIAEDKPSSLKAAQQQAGEPEPTLEEVFIRLIQHHDNNEGDQ